MNGVLDVRSAHPAGIERFVRCFQPAVLLATVLGVLDHQRVYQSESLAGQNAPCWAGQKIARHRD
jgi:hypothetical protein